MLFKNEGEVKKYYEGCTTDRDDTNPEPLKTFESKNEALKELKNYKTSISFRKLVEEIVNCYNNEYYDINDIWDDLEEQLRCLEKKGVKINPKYINYLVEKFTCGTLSTKKHKYHRFHNSGWFIC